MRKGLIYGMLFVAALLLPNNAVELGKIIPVETVSVSCRDGLFLIETDTEDLGIGPTLDSALQNLKDTAAGRIYLDTAEYLIAEQNAMEALGPLVRELKGNVRLCERQGDVDMKTVGQFLREHTPEVKLKCWEMGDLLQVLKGENGQIKLM